MHLTRYTDFGLRVLMYLTQGNGRETPVTIPEIAARFDVSRNHMVKVVHFLARQGWVATTPAKGGGTRLAHPPSTYRVGDMVGPLDHPGALTTCADPPRTLNG